MGRRQWSVWHQACYCPGQLELNPWGTVWSTQHSDASVGWGGWVFVHRSPLVIGWRLLLRAVIPWHFRLDLVWTGWTGGQKEPSVKKTIRPLCPTDMGVCQW
jgi:hypothetical protein